MVAVVMTLPPAATEVKGKVVDVNRKEITGLLHLLRPILRDSLFIYFYYKLPRRDLFIALTVRIKGGSHYNRHPLNGSLYHLLNTFPVRMMLAKLHVAPEPLKFDQSSQT